MKKIDKIIIIGAGGHARSSIDIIEGTKKFEIIGCFDKNYPKINVDDGLGKAVELIVQYGVPYTAALKIASKVSKVKDLVRVEKAGGVSGVAAKVGYYGLPAAISEPIVATSRDATLGQALGLYPDEFMKQLDPTQYEGRDRAAAS